jgi:glycosyltransferase involved in cell wall biosynthesis/GT2 family glycosyltransferase
MSSVRPHRESSFVSCVMPTRDRQSFIPRAIAAYLSQDHPWRELVILDDGEHSIAPLVPDDPRIRYERVPQRMVLGAKRNLACESARGDVILHWDDDDWYPPDRISRQVAALRASDADVCGVNSLLFWDPVARTAWRYTYPPEDGRPWVAGSSMCYTRAFWERNRFDAVSTGEDTRMLWRSRSPRVVAIDGDLVVALIHSGNTAGKNTGGSRWRRADEDEVLQLMGEDNAALYASALRDEAPPHPGTDVAGGASTSATSGRTAPHLGPVRRVTPGERVLIGIHATVDPDGLRATLSSLAANTSVPHDVVLLGDGPSSEMQAALRGSDQLPEFSTEEARGGAACFNRLTGHANADVYVLLESGAQVAPGWLERMLGGLGAHPDNGLAGPSTNRAWNEQAVFRRLEGGQQALERASHDLLRRFGRTSVTLEPLYSLADFCYVVRREVVRAIGPADEAYGLGGRWEMDLNVRAARAGFRGVWVKAAYVQRAPLTDRRRREEQEHGATSRARYRAKFCGGCPRADRRDGHCHGEVCEGFARDIEGSVVGEDSGDRSSPAPPRPSVTGTRRAPVPLVSCLMPTGGRDALARRAVEYFRRQDYPWLELVVVDDGPGSLGRLLPPDDRVRYVRLDEGLSIGAKRDLARDLARGDLIAQWDDDDWYAPERISRQAEAILDGRADVTGIRGGLFFDAVSRRFLRLSSDAHQRMFAQDVIGGTLVYRRSLLSAIRYPERSLAEDASFLRAATQGGARLVKVPNDRLFVYVRHGGNSWRFEPGYYLGSSHWQVVDEPLIPRGDQLPYLQFARACAAG